MIEQGKLRRFYLVLGTGSVLALAVVLGWVIYSFNISAGYVFSWGKENVYWPLVKTLKETLLNPFFMAAMGGILLLERFFPANPKQKVISLSLFQDFCWLLVDAVTKIMIVGVYVGWLAAVYAAHFDFLTIRAVEEWPYVVRIVWGIVIADFFFWFHHWLRHKVQWFWYFHVIHHSQRNLNQFSDDRYHFVEYVIENTVNIIPMLMLSVNTPQIVLVNVLRKWYTRVYHSNIKANFGWLRYILVTPQSHRIHHSLEKRHLDKNFGVLFSVWDQMFGTQYRGWDEYPQTGIEDPLFPEDTTRRGVNVFTVMLAQLVYPFYKIGRSVIETGQKLIKIN